ncbi:MAG TPA: reverse transcriptase family protein [Thermomonas sp.]|nr:reverse transcriptase family protein [Thermomonas sp.]
MDSAAPLPSTKIDLRTADSVERLATALGVHPDFFSADFLQQRKSFYLQHSIPKKSRHRSLERRVVWEPLDPVSRVHKTIARRLNAYLLAYVQDFPHPAAFGYVRGRSTLANAFVHAGKRLLVRADITNFFPSITTPRVREALVRTGIPEKSATPLSELVTLDGHLPLGLHSSPTLANLVCTELDVDLDNLAKSKNCRYTRYADDISISGNSTLPDRQEIQFILERHEFDLSDRKFRVSKRGQAHYVTGLSISDAVPHAPSRMKRRVRQELHFIRKFGFDEHFDRIGERFLQRGINRLDGTINYVASIEKSSAEHFRATWHELLQDSGHEPTFQTRGANDRSISVYIDESEFKTNDRPQLALAFARTEEPHQLSAVISDTVGDYLADPFSKGDKSIVQKRGLHYSEIHFDLRTRFLEKMPPMPFSAAISFQEIEPEKYQTAYLDLYSRLLRQLLSTSDGATLKIVIEQNSKVSRNQIEELTKRIYFQISLSGGRAPQNCPDIIFCGKQDEPNIAIVDFIASTFAAYADDDRGGQEKFLEFERVRDKIRYIENADKGQFFTRKRPFSRLKDG